MKKQFRVVLTATREALGITQAELCRRFRVDPPRWNQYEVGKRRITIEVALALRLAFGVTLDWIYVGDSSGLPVRLQRRMIIPCAPPNSAVPA